ncbi:unknown [Clostridium sp. CAG:1013]|nr:unknown [Clostridium sp. CAG:1013]
MTVPACGHGHSRETSGPKRSRFRFAKIQVSLDGPGGKVQFFLGSTSLGSGTDPFSLRENTGFSSVTLDPSRALGRSLTLRLRNAWARVRAGSLCTALCAAPAADTEESGPTGVSKRSARPRDLKVLCRLSFKKAGERRKEDVCQRSFTAVAGEYHRRGADDLSHLHHHSVPDGPKLHLQRHGAGLGRPSGRASQLVVHQRPVQYFLRICRHRPRLHRGLPGQKPNGDHGPGPERPGVHHLHRLRTGPRPGNARL